ncbi:MAG: hypothetical protein AB9891_19655 [Anaerolineaceae bacterium]
MESMGTFPFGQPVKNVKQEDRFPKDVFVLGVYASAVHACWLNANNTPLIQALAVASEPYIFWRGENAESIIQKIFIPKELGRLLPAKKEFNGPSGLALDNLILNPLKLDRQKVWLCDLVPHSCANDAQRKAIAREYSPIVKKFGLAEHSVSQVPNPLIDENRRMEILDEFMESGAGTLILLGDQPIKWFLNYFIKHAYKLADFGRDGESYGRLHDVLIGDKVINVLPLAHPRQIAKLGQSSPVWYGLHEIWLKKTAGSVSRVINV